MCNLEWRINPKNYGKKSKPNKNEACLICGVKVRTNPDQTCGTPECRTKAHNKFHKLIQESSQDPNTGTAYKEFI